MDEPRKRPAIEVPQALVQHDDDSGTPTRRPFTTTLGSFFVLSRALAGALWLAAFLLFWPTVSVEQSVAPGDAQILGWIVAVVSSVSLIVLILLGWLIWRGNNGARILVMLGLTLSVITAAVGYFAMGEKITIDTTLLVVGLDILVLLALSSRDSRAWARRRSNLR